MEMLENAKLRSKRWHKELKLQLQNFIEALLAFQYISILY